MDYKQDAKFLAEWEKLGYMYSDSNIEKVYLGWKLAENVNTDELLENALAAPLKTCDGEDTTVHYYLYKLLFTLWDDKDSFSGKRPFGNSCWEYDLYQALIIGGFVASVDKAEANLFAAKLINYIFSECLNG